MVLKRVALLALLCAAAFGSAPVLADTPADCRDFFGSWQVLLSAPIEKGTDCSVVATNIRATGFKLLAPNLVVDDLGQKGNFTQVYNQGMEVWLGGRIYFAYSAYNESASFCDQTSIGWVHDMDGSNWQCYQAERISKRGPSILLTEGINEAPIRAAKAARRADKLAAQKKRADQVAHQTYTPDLDYLAAINAAQSDFTVGVYPEFEKMTYGQLQRMSGSAVGNLKDSLPEAPVVRKMSRGPVSALPAAFDWRNVSGVNYVSPVRNQGSCGSCYAFSALGMLEARIRVKSHNTKQPILSPQDVVSCTDYSQGCEGGFPYLTGGKYGRDFGVAEEACYPYQGIDSQCKPNPQPGCNKQRWFTNEYYYVGGYYGASNAQQMKEEIMTNGPIAVSFLVTPEFHAYKGGVFSTKATKHLSTSGPWLEVNHAVLAVGWGVTDTNVPFWIVKNSWGEGWGESGYFRILRTEKDGGELNIESITVAALPILH